jgi:putative CocE/NonD family hydrolase
MSMTSKTLRLLGLLSLVLGMVAAPLAPAVAEQTAATAAPAEQVIDRFEKQTFMVPMRDGSKLYTEIYTPKAATGPLPILFSRTPYGTGMSQAGMFQQALKGLADDGYIFAFQDIRGRYKSDGAFTMLRPLRDKKDKTSFDEATDAQDSITWMLKNAKGNNGKIGMWGISYGAWLSVMAAADPHPALRAIAPQASPADMFIGDDFYHNGAFRLSYGFEYVAMMERGKENNPFDFDSYDTYEWYRRLGPLTAAKAYVPDAPTWRDFSTHTTYDTFWERRAVGPQLGKLKVAALNTGGWWDQEDPFGPAEIYKTWRKDDDQHLDYLVVGPWNHGGSMRGDGRSLGPIQFDQPTTEYYRDQVLRPFFAYYLKDQGQRPSRVQLFETGSNQWRKLEDWKAAEGEVKRLYFHADGKLSFDAPSEADAADRYVSDPANPVPYRPRPIESSFATMKGGKSGWATWLVGDQRFVEGRPDVLTYVSEPLTEDVSISGDVLAKLYASTSGSDGDFMVKLIDVYPAQYDKAPEMGGYQLMVSIEALRGRFRNGFKTPEAFTPGKVEAFTVDLRPRVHSFLKGHRIMVQIQSTMFPLYDRNPQTFVPNIFEAKASDFKAATITVHRDAGRPSHIEVRGK